MSMHRYFYCYSTISVICTVFVQLPVRGVQQPEQGVPAVAVQPAEQQDPLRSILRLLREYHW